MGEERKTITRAAHVPWFDVGDTDVKNLIPPMGENAGGAAFSRAYGRVRERNPGRRRRSRRQWGGFRGERAPR
eukprot:6885234-Alexandrium_andersonii.AAC.1